MLTIRDEQWRVFADCAESAFINRVVAHLQRALPEICAEMGEDAVRLSVARGIQRAREYRIDSEYDVVRFIDFLYVLGFEFDTEHAWARDILTDKLVPAEMRLDMIDDYLDEPEPDGAEVEDG
ncbi:MAG: hypothetical protein LAQ69_49910 [Acidobacteriia bacterium]|nr:hypothetical protein [Terriglobia bacterium]